MKNLTLLITKYMTDKQQQDVGEIIADVLMNLDPDSLKCLLVLHARKLLSY
jgi:hypothetical protein